MNPQIENNFKYHPPKDELTANKHDATRFHCKVLADFFDRCLPNSREKSLAMTKLEEAMMWANAAIARNQEEK